MRTFFAVVIGLAVTGLLLFVGDASFAHITDTAIVAGYAGTSHSTEFVALLWTFVCISLGALVTVSVRNSNEAIAGFIVGELFFGVGLLHQFWHAPSWYSAVAILLVIPAALVGAWIGWQVHHGVTARA
jgi:hypothetical protein